MTEANLHIQAFSERELEGMKKELGLVGAWVQVMTRPVAFFRRVGVGHEAYGEDLLVASKEIPDSFLFFMLVNLIRLALGIAIRGEPDEVIMTLMNGAGMLVGTAISFFLLAGICLLLARIFRCARDYDAAKSVVGFAAAPLVLPTIGGPGALMSTVAWLYMMVLTFLGVRHGFRTTAFRALSVTMGMVVIQAVLVAVAAAI